jgi:hypothetical protein
MCEIVRRPSSNIQNRIGRSVGAFMSRVAKRPASRSLIWSLSEANPAYCGHRVSVTVDQSRRFAAAINNVALIGTGTECIGRE